MAELHVQRKETNVWPWIIGALLVGAVVWFVFMRGDTREMTSSTPESVYQTQPVPGAPVTPPPGTP